MPDKLLDYFYLFALFSISGWFLEFVYRSIRDGRIVNPGFLKGPYLPIYGTAAVILCFVIDHSQTINILTKGFVYFFVTTGLELVTGYVFDGYFHKRLWDYSDQPFHINSYVCLKYSIYWVILAFIFEHFLLPPALRFQSLFNVAVLGPFVLFILFIMSLDGVGEFYKPIIAYRKRKLLFDTENDGWEEFNDIAKHLIEHPDVYKLSHFRHHNSINRLEHSLEVAWISYLVARRFSLDNVAIVRGALLHDLFFYDWLHEGPRLHGIHHPKISLKNAKEVTALSPKEIDIIKKHMWPLTIFPPCYVESWIVCFVDTYCTIKDYFMMLKNVYEK
jgi:uncharacterized protein